MALALTVTAIIMLALTWEVAAPIVRERRGARARLRAADPGIVHGYDPGRERRAEQRARQLLRSCVGGEDWEMYRDLGFLRRWGTLAGGPDGGGRAQDGAPYAYLIYPHGPLVAYLPQTGELLSEYCVAFPDETRPYGSPRLPDSDDVLAKWLALSGDERGLIERANMHQAGRQIDPERVRADLQRLGRWERARAAGAERGLRERDERRGPAAA